MDTIQLPDLEGRIYADSGATDQGILPRDTFEVSVRNHIQWDNQKTNPRRKLSNLARKDYFKYTRILFENHRSIQGYIRERSIFRAHTKQTFAVRFSP